LFQANDNRRKSFSGSTLTSHAYGSRLKAAYVTSYEFGSEATMHRLTFAADRETEDYHNVATGVPGPINNVRNLSNTGIVGEYFLDLGGRTGIGGAVRHDWNEHFESATTFRLQGSHLLGTGTRLHAAAGSGIKNPTNFELFGFNPTTFIGNPDLKPEKSLGYEAGFAQEIFAGQIVFDVTYFNSTLEDEIFTSFTPSFVAMPQNRRTDSKQQGIELSLEALLSESWRIFAAYTWLEAEENKIREIRRASHIASLNVGWRAPTNRFGANDSIRYTGEQPDSNFGTGERVTLPAFTLVNLDADFRITEQVQLYGRVENALDDTHEEIFSFRGQGRAIHAGLRIRT
jgi:vitamin B12 transporter